MLEKLKYINHLGEEIQFGSGGIYVNSNDLHDFSWAITAKNDLIAAFRKGIVKKSLPVQIVCNSEEEGIAARNMLYEIMEKDVLAMQYGKIVIGDYYLKCYVTESKKSEYLTKKRIMQVTLGIQTDKPFWTREALTEFGYGHSGLEEGLDYNNDFDYDYTSNLLGQMLKNKNFAESDFRLRIYGAATNPKITIGGHDYEVFVEFLSNEYLEIDSKAKTIILTHRDGTKENCFNKRNKESYIFEKIKAGINLVASNGDFKFDAIILEERGEPKWI